MASVSQDAEGWWLKDGIWYLNDCNFVGLLWLLKPDISVTYTFEYVFAHDKDCCIEKLWPYPLTTGYTVGVYLYQCVHAFVFVFHLLGGRIVSGHGFD